MRRPRSYWFESQRWNAKENSEIEEKEVKVAKWGTPKKNIYFIYFVLFYFEILFVNPSFLDSLENRYPSSTAATNRKGLTSSLFLPSHRDWYSSSLMMMRRFLLLKLSMMNGAPDGLMITRDRILTQRRRY